MNVALSLLIVLLVVTGARAERIVANLSTDVVRITSEFAGDRLSLFGVIERDAQTVARAGKYQVVVLVRGPPIDVLVQQRERRAGIWVNADGVRLRRIPSFLAIFASEEARSIIETQEANTGPLSLAGATGVAPRFASSRDAFIADRAGDNLYLQEIGAVEMLTDTFFRTLIPLPGLVRDGVYTVEVGVFADGLTLDRVETQFVVTKVGFEERLSQLARDEPLAYGLGVVALALLTGYVGGVVFRRN